MIVQNEINTIKSKEDVIRSVYFEFNHFSVDQMDILKHVISDYSGTNVATFTKGKSCVIKMSDCFVFRHLIDEGVRIYDSLLPLLNIELHIWGKPIKKCILYVKAPLNIVDITSKHIKQCIIKITRKIGNDIYCRLIEIERDEVKLNHFIQDIAIWDGDFYGEYDFGVMQVDFGCPNPNRRTCKIARCVIRYNQYRINWENVPVYSFIERESKIYLTLLQCFLRFPIYKLSGEDIFLPSHTYGKYIAVNRDDCSKDYIYDRINNAIVPDDISELFILYGKLEDNVKNIFFNAVCLYCEGMKLEGTKAVSYYVICLETLAAYEAKMAGKKDINKIDMIYEFLQTTFTKPTLNHKSVEELYSIRSAYVHNGIANNDFLDEVFMKSLISNSHCEIVERIANYALITWLKRK